MSYTSWLPAIVISSILLKVCPAGIAYGCCDDQPMSPMLDCPTCCSSYPYRYDERRISPVIPPHSKLPPSPYDGQIVFSHPLNKSDTHVHRPRDQSNCDVGFQFSRTSDSSLPSSNVSNELPTKLCTLPLVACVCKSNVLYGK